MIETINQIMILCGWITTVGGAIMVEVFDMLQAMILDADFRDERQAIMQQIRKLADS